MKLEEFRKICRDAEDKPNLSKFNKMFCEFVLKSPEEKAIKLMEIFPEVTEELRGLK